jgi:hypothetical protein
MAAQDYSAIFLNSGEKVRPEGRTFCYAEV